MAIQAVSKDIYSGYNCKLDVIVRGTGTSAPAWNSPLWDSSGNVLFVGTGFRSGASCEVTEKHGLGQQRPYATKQGYLKYDFSIDSLYTIDRYYTDNDGANYDILELIDNGVVLDIRVTLYDGIGEDSNKTPVKYIVLGGCSIESSDFEVGTDKDASSAMSGKAESRTVSAPA